MPNVRSLAITAALLLGMQPVGAATGKGDAAPATAGKPDCWVEHTQVQPSPARKTARAEERQRGKAYRSMSEEHPGAEHASRAKKRSCNSVQPDNGLNAALSEPRVMAR